MEPENGFEISGKKKKKEKKRKESVKEFKLRKTLATVYRIVKNIRTGRGIEQEEGSGRPRKLNETDRRLGQLVCFGKFKTLTHFGNETIGRGSLLYQGKPFSMS